MAGTAKSAVAHDLCRHIEVCIRHHHDIIFRATLALHPLAVDRAFAIDVLGNRRGTDKADRAHILVMQQSVNDRLAADHHIANARGQTALVQQLEQQPGGERHTLRRLQDKSVPGGNRIRKKPQRNHGREIEWRDRHRNAQRLANHHLVDTAGYIFQVVPLHHARDAAGHLNIFYAAR